MCRPATASTEKVCYLRVYCMSTYYFLFSNLNSLKDLRHGRLLTCIHDLKMT